MKRQKINKKPIVKVNWTGMSFIAIVFLFNIFIILETNLGVVAAASNTFDSGRTWTYSPTAQYTRPGTYQSFSMEHASAYWPILYDDYKCEASTDFLLFVRPESCTPRVVRSDLLEEQNVPIFCKVDIIKINPLIDVTQLRSVKFKGEYSKYVAGVSFHPNQEAIYSQKGFLDNPLINDVGYVVILLKRIPREADMPDSVKINLTGVLRYDSEGFFGPGQNAYYLQVSSDENWEIGDNYMENPIFKGRGYLRADWIEPNSAKISIYEDKERILTSFNLEKGKTSGVYYMPGFYCRAGVKIKLDDVSAPTSRAILDIDGNQISVVEGEKFLDNLCRVGKINIGKEEDGEKKHSVTLSCKGGSDTLFYEEKIIKEEKGEETEEKPKLKDKEDVDDLIRENFREAEIYARDIDKLYGPAKGKSGEIFAAKALFDLGELAKDIGLLATAENIFYEVIEKYPDSTSAKTAENILSNLKIQGDSVSVLSYRITLLRIETPGFEEGSVEFEIISRDSPTITGEEEAMKILSNVTPNILQIKYHAEVFHKESGNKIYVKDLTEDEATLVVTKDNKKEELKLARGGDFIFIEENKEDRKSAVTLKVKDIKLEQIAKISVISEIKDISEADFSVEIGIEKRGIELSPEKTREMIKNLNESIKEIEKIVEKLGNVVKGMKAACFATSAVLIVKNFFANLEGGATSRQAVMPAWYKRCELEVGKNRAEFDKCLNKYSKEIEQDVQNYKNNIESFNNKFIEAQKAYIIPGTESVDKRTFAEDRRKTVFGVDESTADDFPIESVPTYKYSEDIMKYEIDEEIEIKAGHIKKASPTQLRELEFNLVILDSDASDVAKNEASSEIKSIIDRLDQTINQETNSIGKYYSGSDPEWFNKIKIKYYPGGKEKGLVRIVPLPVKYTAKVKEDGKEELKDVSGFYVFVDETELTKKGGYRDSGEVTYFWIKNIGDKVYEDPSTDYGTRITPNYKGNVLTLTEKDSERIIRDAKQAIAEANLYYGAKRVNILGENILVDTVASSAIEGKRCQDFMSPQDCLILFNVCDPVICPASRCDLGGAYRVDDVIQSGIIGSIALCLPNYKEGIIVPVCLSGVHAGLESYLSILKSHRDCLQESLDTGKMVGICDEIYSIYLCEFFWRQIGPFLDILLMKMIEASYGQGMKGGGEYLTVEDAWTHASQSIDFMKNDYAVNSYKAFQIRSTEEVGTEFCKVFVSAKYPNKGIFDRLIEPDSPVQFHAWFDEIPYSEVTSPATSQYKVFYHIWAGKDIGASYQIYLKDPQGSASPYVYTPSTVMVRTDYIPKGGYVSETRDFTAPAGYQQLCVRINGQDECGFKKVSTSYAINYMSDKYYEEQAAEEDIKTEKQCISGSPSAYSLVQPNIQEGVQDVISPTLDKRGIVRVCSSENPGYSTEPQNWVPVGYCDNEEIECWLDKESVEDVIKNKDIEQGVLEGFSVSEEIEKSIGDLKEIEEKLGQANRDINILEKELDKIVEVDKTESSKKAQIVQILDTTTTNIRYNEKINIREIINGLESIRNSEGDFVTNSIKAEATSLEFKVYYLITKALINIKGAMPETGETGEAGTAAGAETTAPIVSEEPEEVGTSSNMVGIEYASGFNDLFVFRWRNNKVEVRMNIRAAGTPSFEKITSWVTTPDEIEEFRIGKGIYPYEQIDIRNIVNSETWDDAIKKISIIIKDGKRDASVYFPKTEDEAVNIADHGKLHYDLSSEEIKSFIN